MDNFTYLIYTHEEYSDILAIHLKRLAKFCPGLPVSICSNNIRRIQMDHPTVSFKAMYDYDDTKPYGERVRSVLSRMTEQYILYNHDHNIFVKEVDPDFIPTLLEYVMESRIDSVRMVVAGVRNPVFPDEFTLIKNNGDYFMSCFTTLWRREVLLQIATQFSDHSFRCFECPPIQDYTSQFRNFYLSSSRDTPFVNEGHYLSSYFPIAHLTGNGKWRTNTPTNRGFIEEIVKEYNIDLRERGEL